MSNTRNLGELLQADGEVPSAKIDSVAASKLTGTLADARFPATLPTISGENLTGVAPTKSTIETLGIAASSITGALPAISGASLTSLPSQTANDFTNTLKTKLDGVEASADVTDTDNVVAALTAGTNITIASNGTIASIATQFPFYKTNGSADNIIISTDGEFPFYKSNGTQDNIDIIT